MHVQYLTTTLPNDPLTVFADLVGRYDTCFLLESLGDENQPLTTGKSYIGVQPKSLYESREAKFYTDGTSQTGNPFELLARQLTVKQGLGEGYVGGLVGYCSHEAMALIEPSLKLGYQRQFPDFQFGYFEDGLVFDGSKTPAYFTHGSDRRNLYSSKPQPDSRALVTKPLGVKKSQAKYHHMVEQARDDIQNGRVFQVVLADEFSYGYEGNLIELYRELRTINPSPFMFFLKFGNIVTLGASPELLMHTKTDGKLYLEALAGTVKRGATETEDERYAEKLLHDEKELAEHSMLVDLARNDVGRVSGVGSVQVNQLMYLKKLSHVQHLCSLVSGQLAPGQSMFNAFRASFPAGTLVGAPKIEAAKMIDELEGYERGPYGGTVGYFGINGESMHAVNIRSVQAIDERLYLHTGSGIVYDSDPGKEYQEIMAKKAAMDRAMTPFMENTA